MVKAWVLVVSVGYDWLVKWSIDCTGIGEIAGAEFGGSDEEMEQFDVVEACHPAFKSRRLPGRSIQTDRCYERLTPPGGSEPCMANSMSVHSRRS